MHLLSEALLLLLQIVGTIVTLSYVLAWYEHANLNPKLIAGRFTPRNLLLALRLVVVETLLLCVTVLANPFGWLKERPSSASAQQPPILLLHGLFHSRACWWYLRFQLSRQGFANLHSINLPPWKNVEALTELIAMKVDALRHASGFDKVTLIGHSMGGVLARNYLQLRGGATTVESGTFFPAEAYHQNFVNRNPAQPYVAAVALPKVAKLQAAFPEKLKGR
jgi:pimeloyl-ACP methyl ester carboxylesterase